jgi:microcystin-dependent protein
MSDPFLGEIKLVSFNFPPHGWAFCDGQLLPVAQNQALFSVLGTMYGGDGITTFALPDLRGRTPFHTGNGIAVGQSGGAKTHVLTQAEMPVHNHLAQARATTTGTVSSPTGALWATSPGSSFSASAPDGLLSPDTVTTVGAGQAHENRPPFLVLNAVVALQGIFPSRP